MRSQAIHHGFFSTILISGYFSYKFEYLVDKDKEQKIDIRISFGTKAGTFYGKSLCVDKANISIITLCNLIFFLGALGAYPRFLLQTEFFAE